MQSSSASFFFFVLPSTRARAACEGARVEQRVRLLGEEGGVGFRGSGLQWASASEAWAAGALAAEAQGSGLQVRSASARLAWVRAGLTERRRGTRGGTQRRPSAGLARAVLPGGVARALVPRCLPAGCRGPCWRHVPQGAGADSSAPAGRCGGTCGGARGGEGGDLGARGCAQWRAQWGRRRWCAVWNGTCAAAGCAPGRGPAGGCLAAAAEVCGADPCTVAVAVTRAAS